MRLLPMTVLAAALACACGGSSSPPAAPAAPAPSAEPAPAATAPAATAPASSADVVPPGEAKVGDKTLCLVSKEEFVVEATSPKFEYEGKTYYFCCPGCDKKFQQDPQKYLKGEGGGHAH